MVTPKDLLRHRVATGESILRAAWSGRPHEDDRESAATDAISDVLTALYGPAGGVVGANFRIEYDNEALDNAQALLDRAWRSYRGDAEDYYDEEDAA